MPHFTKIEALRVSAFYWAGRGGVEAEVDTFIKYLLSGATHS